MHMHACTYVCRVATAGAWGHAAEAVPGGGVGGAGLKTPGNPVPPAPLSAHVPTRSGAKLPWSLAQPLQEFGHCLDHAGAMLGWTRLSGSLALTLSGI